MRNEKIADLMIISAIIAVFIIFIFISVALIFSVYNNPCYQIPNCSATTTTIHAISTTITRTVTEP